MLVLWKNPPSSMWLMDFVGVTFVYKGLQISVSWVTINAILWLWLILQRVLYCSIWQYWSYESEYRDFCYPWWHQVWSSYYPAPEKPPVMSSGFISWIIAMLIALTTLGCAIFTDRLKTYVKETSSKIQNTLVVVKAYTEWTRNRTQEILTNREINDAMDESEIGSICDDGRSEISNEAINSEARGDVHPISWGTNWMPQPNSSVVKDAQRKLSIKSLHTVAGANDVQDSDKVMAKQVRYRRNCHTVIPSNSSEQSSGC
ncbi:uncharacterized protein LOC109862547 isoform X2 [Pseudomyrmex gracilis]|nr:uncharacterized protein LOC109862547 isoform X2 [Pseudomyrmex gracilis]